MAALRASFHTRSRLYVVKCLGDREERSPAEEFAPLATKFQRRLLVGVGSASVVAVGANLGGITSSFLGLSPEIGRNIKLDMVYPIGGYSRYMDENKGFEFLYPAEWVGDQMLLYRIAKKNESERSLDPPPLKGRLRPNINAPTVAFSPPGSTGEINVSVIVSSVPLDFSIEAFGGPEEVGEAVIRSITGSLQQRPDVKGRLIKANLREDLARKAKYYELEFEVESPSFQRHNVAVCCAAAGRLFTLNAQAPESAWPDLQSQFYRIAHSFNLNV